MISIFSRKQQKMQSLLKRYLEDIELTQENFCKALRKILGQKKEDDLTYLIKETHRFESQADDAREEINTLMYEKVLLPELRGDIMDLLERIDQIPRYFEVVLNMIRTQGLGIPDFLTPDLEELLKVTMESCTLMIRQVEDLFRKGKRIRELLDVIDGKESQCDKIERRLIIEIFGSDLDPFIKLQLKELVIILGDISDQADRVSKRTNIINLKRRV